MTRRPTPTSGFAAFPREIRDMVFSCIASAAGLDVHYYEKYCLYQDAVHEDFAQCIDMLYEWAPRSYIAKGACEVLWPGRNFRHGFHSDSDIIINPDTSIYLSKRAGKGWVRRSVDTAIELRQSVQKIRLYTNPFRYLHGDPADGDTMSVLLKQELFQLSKLPHLRQVELEIWLPHRFEVYFHAMTYLERIYDTCKDLRA